MFGHEAPKRETHAEREASLRLNRETRLRQFIKENRPVSAIAMAESLEFAYAKQLVRKLIKAENLEYNPPRVKCSGDMPIEGLTEESRDVRGHLANSLARLKDEPREITRKIGILFRSIKTATIKPNNYDWSLSQIERLARASNKTYKQLMLEALLTPEEKAKAIKCGIL